MKVIQVPLDDKLLRSLNREAKASKSTRAALIRRACHEYLRTLEERELDRQYIEGYRRKPENPAWGEAVEKLLAEVWPQEEWPEGKDDEAR
jgi:hypothetical protein